jgi:hypothetical protein
MSNMTNLHSAAVAVAQGNDALNNGRALLALALVPALDTGFTAIVGGKKLPFILSDYAFKPKTDKGETDGKLRNAQFAAIMHHGMGEPENTKDVNPAVKTAFNETFPAALYMRANGLNIALEDGALNGVPLAFAFECFNRDGELTDTGKAMIDKVKAMFSPDKGPELTDDEAHDELFTRTVDNVCGVMSRRYGMKTATISKVLHGLKAAAINAGLVEAKASRAPRNGASDEPKTVIAAFDTFLAKIIGKDGESDIALDGEGIKALKALQNKVAAAIKAAA